MKKEHMCLAKLLYSRTSLRTKSTGTFGEQNESEISKLDRDSRLEQVGEHCQASLLGGNFSE